MTTSDIAATSLPIAPAAFEDVGLPRELVTELVRKALHGAIELSGAEIAKRLGLPFSSIEDSLDVLKTQHQCEIVVGGIMIGGASFRYRLTEAGHSAALASLDRNHYSGFAPVPIRQYRRYMEAFSRSTSDATTPADVRKAFSELVLADQVLNELGPAISARHSIFIYGPPGNGKTVMARTIRNMHRGTIAVPHAIEVGGHIIRFFDPGIHEPVHRSALEDPGVRSDQRWIECRRPMVTVGGELTLDALGLGYNPRSGVYSAPVQSMANGGVLVIDDFGRQRCSPRDLLNWWMIPLESRVEYLTLQSGEKLEMPFEALVIFATNIRPADLVDEAFLRRIQYKIYAENPTPADFAKIFEHCCAQRGVPFDQALVDDLLEHVFLSRGIELRACQPRDLIRQALAVAAYRGQPRRLTSDLLRAACLSYFIDEREDPRS